VEVEKPQRSGQLFQIPVPSNTAQVLLLDFERKSNDIITSKEGMVQFTAGSQTKEDLV